MSLPEIEFLMESDKLKSVLRRSLLHDGSRRENSAEHSWQLALAVLAARDLADEEIDLGRALSMAVLHDLVEIDAGDTFVYDEAALTGKAERERAAARRLYGLLPEPNGSRLRDLWLEYEKQACPESRFVNALDRFLPVLANCRTGGRSWREHGVRRGQVLAKNSEIEKGSRRLWLEARRMIEECPGLED